MTHEFESALDLILKHEGGYVNDPLDRGGATNKGITQAVYDSYRTNKKLPVQSVKLITNDEVTAIYYQNYWLDGHCDSMPPGLNSLHFDFSVNAGITQAMRTFQRVVGTNPDGVFGPKTKDAIEKAISTRGVNALIDAYSDERVAYYITITVNRPTNLKFLMGWFKRTLATKANSKEVLT